MSVKTWRFRRWAVLVMGFGSCILAAAPSVHDLDAQYKFMCAQCHGLNGNSKGPSGVKLPGRVLADRRWLARQKNEDLLRSILEGKGAMPSFKHKMTPEEAKRMIGGVLRPMARKAR